MKNEIFSGLEDLGFDQIDDIDLYNNKEDEEKIQEENVDTNKKIESYIFEKQYTCPVCGNVFKSKAVKSNYYRMSKRDSDFFKRYTLINPYFYDVVLCNSCGYTAMQSDFTKIRSYQIPLIIQKITSKWRGRIYPDFYDVNIAIERYKLSLLNYYVMEARASKKAVNCLKIAWMYRLLDDSENEILFLKQSLEGFNDAYYNEDFPIYGMDRFTTIYLIGELNRRIGDKENALQWFSSVITAPNAAQRIKDMARDQKDLIKETEVESLKEEYNETEDFTVEKKKGFFSKLFS